MKTKIMKQKSMRTSDEKHLHFVLHYYQKNKLDTQKALKAFKEKHQITEQKRKSLRLWWILPAMAAASLAVVLLFPYLHKDEAWKEVTAYSHPVNYMLPDSSSITLYPNSSVRFHIKDYRNSNRKIHMEGKVAFSVKHNNNHPFTVEGRLSQVRVLGTVFTVDESRADTAVVQVMSGKVQFSATGQPHAVILTEGMAAQVTGKRQDVQIIKERETGNFIFDNTPLPKVLEELSKFYKVKLTTGNTDKRLTAHFKDKDLDEIIQIIERVLNVKIEKKKQ